MQELEKILEEIEQYRKQASDNGNFNVAAAHEKDMDVIRKHMNDGQIPVEERLPDNNENVLVTTDMGLITSGYIAHGTWITDQEPDYPISWRPLPEPYRPERSEGK